MDHDGPPITERRWTPMRKTFLCPCDLFAAFGRVHYSCGLHQSLRLLASNLSIGAMLCRAFRVGYDAGFGDTGEGFNGEYTNRTFTAERYERLATFGNGDDFSWRPGCQRSAP